MKTFFLSITLIFVTLQLTAQEMTLQQWNQEAQTNIRLLPKYGQLPKNEHQKNADKEFIEATMKQFSDARKASDHLIALGFKYLYKDIKTAMYRFNQAYLMDSTNADIYWGFGGIYTTLGDFKKAARQYREGLLIAPKNPHLLTDYGTWFMAQSKSNPGDNKQSGELLDSAIHYLEKSYSIDPKDQNTSFKLSAVYFYKGDCKNAWKYWDICTAAGGDPITEDYTNALKKQCKSKHK